MNLHNAAAIVRDDVTTVRVVHAHDIKGTSYDTSCAKRYDYKILRTLAKEVRKGVYIVVKNGMGITVAIVEEVHDEPQIDLENDKHINYRWAFQIVDTDTIEQREIEDERIVERLRTKQRENVRQQTLAALGLSGFEVHKLIHDVDSTHTETGRS